MWREGDGGAALARPEGSARLRAPAPAFTDRGAPPGSRAAPARLQLIELPAGTSLSDAASVLLALHAEAIGKNFDCLFESTDPEGPHQLRVSLRRLRVALRAFRPAIRSAVRRDLTAAARELGAIVGELRDADVIIDERIAPHTKGAEYGALNAALGAWRSEVRGRVRARLRSAKGAAFAHSLQQAATRGALVKRTPPTTPMGEVLALFLQQTWRHAAPLAWRLATLTHDELHDLRKYTKTVRYALDLAATVGEARPDMLRSLKRIQDILGEINDAYTFERFDPPIGAERVRLAALRAQRVAQESVRVAGRLAEAADEWRTLARSWTAGAPVASYSCAQ